MDNHYPTLTKMAHAMAAEDKIPEDMRTDEFRKALSKDLLSLLENIEAINLYMKFGLKDE